MPCMVGLPDGTFLILNGAVQGMAGFGLANNPNLGALLYDPSMPFNERISILNTTIVARLYHSEARHFIQLFASRYRLIQGVNFPGHPPP